MKFLGNFLYTWEQVSSVVTPFGTQATRLTGETTFRVGEFASIVFPVFSNSIPPAALLNFIFSKTFKSNFSARELSWMRNDPKMRSSGRYLTAFFEQHGNTSWQSGSLGIIRNMNQNSPWSDLTSQLSFKHTFSYWNGDHRRSLNVSKFFLLYFRFFIVFLCTILS